MSPFFLIDFAALSGRRDVPRNPLQEAVPMTALEALVRLFTSRWH